MPEYSQKWTLVCFLESVENGSQFHWKQWPLHITLMNAFAANRDTHNLLDAIEREVLATHSCVLRVVNETVWGEHEVALLEYNPIIMKLHTRVYEILVDSGAVFNEPQYVGSGYLPHSTHQSHAALHVGQTAALSHVALVDMFPGGDYQQRLVRQIFRMNG